jgi:hypothetical protein
MANQILWGIFVAGLIILFFASAFGAMWLLVLMGWNPLSRGVYLYAAIAIAYSVGLMAVVAIFRWAKKPSRIFQGQ